MLVTDTARYSSKIIKASALLGDTRMLLAHWDEQRDVAANLDRMRQDNILGKASRSRVADILTIFRQRYLRDDEVLRALTVLVKCGMPAEALNRILYFLAVQSDPLLHDAVVDVLAGVALRGQRDVSMRQVSAWVRQQVMEGHTERPWGPETTERVAQGVMATLRDFGVLQGAVNKHLAPSYLPSTSFAFIAYLLHRRERSGDRLLHDPEWRVFFLSPQAVERFFLEAHQDGLLSYHAAGQVIRIEFPAATLGDYARVLT